jgi:hypothetical protein
MARIRTIKPEFFTSEDIVSCSPLARILYIGLWCEADREGRMAWKPRTLKMRYLPGDSCDLDALSKELIDAEMIAIYEVDGVVYAEIPTFSKHQVINNRESASAIPARVRHASMTRESGRKEGKEGKGTTRRVDDDDGPPPLPPVGEPVGFSEFWAAWPASDRKQSKGKCLEVWRKQKIEGVASVVIDHIDAIKTSAGWTKNGGEFIPAPLVYLNQRRWEGADAAPSVSGLNLIGGI